MTSATSSGTVAGAKAMVWFPDTSALVTLAVHFPLQQAVQAMLSAHRRVLVTAVVVELEELAKFSTPRRHVIDFRAANRIIPDKI